MLKVKFADVVVGIQNKYSFIERQCENYIELSNVAPDLVLSVSNEEIESEVAVNPFGISKEVAESLCVYRALSKKLSLFDAFLLHSSIISKNNEGFVFLGKSGTGKSTHANLWKERFTEDVVFVNDDKPIIRKIGNIFFAYGTPYSGKRNLNNNTSVKVSALYFLEQSKENSIKRLGVEDAFTKLMTQVVLPESKEEVEKVLGLFEEFVSSVPVYLLKCNISFDAVDLAYTAYLEGK